MKLASDPVFTGGQVSNSPEQSTAYPDGILELVYRPAPSAAPGGQALADAGDADE
jgi:hypothetical protein